MLLNTAAHVTDVSLASWLQPLHFLSQENKGSVDALLAVSSVPAERAQAAGAASSPR